MNNDEIWKDVIGYEGLYKVSNFGNVKSFKRNKITGVLLTPQLKKDGYYDICLGDKNGKIKTFRVHRLVALAFILNPNNFLEIKHKDNNFANNNSENLEWKERKRLYDREQAFNIRKLWNTGLYKRKDIANIYNCHISTIDRIIGNKTHKDKSYIKKHIGINQWSK